MQSFTLGLTVLWFRVYRFAVWALRVRVLGFVVAVEHELLDYIFLLMSVLLFSWS